MTIILNGKELSEKILNEIKEEVAKLSVKPHLTVIQIGDNPASSVYVGRKNKVATELGIKSTVLKLPEQTSEKELLEIIGKLNADKNVTAILVQLPLPKHINEKSVIDAIDYKKDVDGFSIYNMAAIAQGREPLNYPCTPKGVIKLLDEYNVPIEGRHAVVIGRSNIVGRPLSMMLLNRNATVTICHSKTENLKEITKQADILVAAVGKANFVTADMVKENACVIDVGINRLPSGKLTGDVCFDEVSQKAAFITPVPKGVGPMTIAMLMENTVTLFLHNSK